MPYSQRKLPNLFLKRVYDVLQLVWRATHRIKFVRTSCRSTGGLSFVRWDDEGSDRSFDAWNTKKARLHLKLNLRKFPGPFRGLPRPLDAFGLIGEAQCGPAAVKLRLSRDTPRILEGKGTRIERMMTVNATH